MKFVPCTAECEVLGHDRPEFDVLDPNNPRTGGIRLRHTSLPSQVSLCVEGRLILVMLAAIRRVSCISRVCSCPLSSST